MKKDLEPGASCSSNLYAKIKNNTHGKKKFCFSYEKQEFISELPLLVFNLAIYNFLEEEEEEEKDTHSLL